MACIFCEIITGKSPAQILFSDDFVIAFRDTRPIASTHILVVTIQHLASVNQLQQEDESLVGHMVLVAKKLAEQEGIANNGYRLIINTGVHARQTVFHLHMHLIGGRLSRFLVH